MVNGSGFCNVFWNVGTSATLNTNTAFLGNILAMISITLDTGASVHGRLLAYTGAVTLASNDVTVCATCSASSLISSISTTTVDNDADGDDKEVADDNEDADADDLAESADIDPTTPTTRDVSEVSWIFVLIAVLIFVVFCVTYGIPMFIGRRKVSLY